MKQPISYTDAEIEQIRNDEKWLSAHDGVCIGINIIVDTINDHGQIFKKVAVGGVVWGATEKYRLHNGPGYKDGIAIDETKEYVSMPTQPQTYTFPTRDGGIASVDLKPGEILVKDSEGYFHVETEDKSDTGPLGTHFKLDEQAGCKITELKEQGPSTRDKLIALLNDNEAMEAIALEACLEQQKVIDKAAVIAAKSIIIEKALVFAEKDEIVWTLRQFTEHLSERGFLTLPEGDL